MSLREWCWGARWGRGWEWRERASLLRPLVGPGVCVAIMLLRKNTFLTGILAGRCRLSE